MCRSVWQIRLSARSPSIGSSESGAILSSCGRNSIRSMSAISISLVIWKGSRLCLAEIGRLPNWWRSMPSVAIKASDQPFFDRLWIGWKGLQYSG